jgi:hypothetical protein
VPSPVDGNPVPRLRPVVAAFGLVCSFMNSGTGGCMSAAVCHARFVAVARLIALAAWLAVPVCSVAQDRQSAGNVGKDEDEIKRLISMYAKACGSSRPNAGITNLVRLTSRLAYQPSGSMARCRENHNFYRHNMDENYSSRKLTITDISVRVYADAAWAEFNWEFSATKKRGIVSFIPWHGNPDL